jgi:hypothetical protein
MDKPDFYLVSIEGYREGEPRSCKRIKRMRSDHRDDFLLIRVEPPLIGQSFGLGGEDIDTLAVATKHVGASLFPINEWPIYVYVLRLLIENPEEREQVHDNEFECIDWAALYRTEEEARAHRMRL